jgi:ribosomal protein S18 acetylase RimI-like enzyme
MNYTIEKIDENNHSLFDDMVFWRENGFEREPSQESVSEQIKKELLNPDLFVYAVKVDGRYVGWISCVYIAKVGKWKGHGHIYVDELWVEPSFRGNGFAKALLKKADELKDKFNAPGIRLYVNVNNPVAQNLYETCGYVEDGRAIFMEK